MAANNSNPISTFCWNQLATPNIDESIVFYSALFGWDVVEEDLADGGTTVRLAHKGDFVVGMHVLSEIEVNHGWKARWEPFLRVDNIPDVLVRVSEQPGQVLEGDVSAGTHGTLATISSPSGAQLCLWEAGSFSGQGMTRQNGVPSWHTLLVSNLDIEHTFWSKVVGWGDAQEAPELGLGHFTHPVHGNIAGSRVPSEEMKTTLGQLDCRWVPHIQVADCNQTVESAKAIGATVLLATEEVPNGGTQALIVDPLGGVFGVYTPRED